MSAFSAAAGYEGQIVVGAFRPNGNERTREDGSPKRERGRRKEEERKERPSTMEGKGKNIGHLLLLLPRCLLG